MALQTKTMRGLAADTSLNTSKYTPQIDANGNVTKVLNSTMIAGGAPTVMSTAQSALGGYSPNQIMVDNIFIFYHRSSDSFPLMAKPDKWSSGDGTAEGVVVVEGGHVLVVATEEPEAGNLLWSSANVTSDTSITDRLEAINDWNGKTHTANVCAKHSESILVNTDDYAPGFCNRYSINKMTAGRWWLPSVGEMMMIYANMRKINYALSIIESGGQTVTKLQETSYWTSTEYSASNAWYLHLLDGRLNDWGPKASGLLRVRPVSAFLQ